MAISGNDIVYTLSGGSGNSNPNNSLGGGPSSTPIVSNRLFSDITNDEAIAGKIDYRCFYVANNNVEDTFFDSELMIFEEIVGGSDISFGVSATNDVQQIIVSSSNAQPPNGGSFTISHEQENVVINWNLNISTIAQNIQDSLNYLNHLSDVVVVAQQSVLTNYVAVFTVTFAGKDGKRNQELFDLVSNNLLGTGTYSITFSKVVEGSPINMEAQTIPFETTTPFGVVFGTSTVQVGDLRSGDLFPVWVRRTTPEQADPLENDGVVFRLTGKAF